MYKHLWATPRRAAEVIAGTGKREFILFYELAPTGLVHAGLLRTLLRAHQVKMELTRSDLRARFILGLSDRAALKASNYLPNPEPYLGCQLKNVPSPEPTARSYFDWSCSDILRAVDEYEISVDDFLYDDTFYCSAEYRRLTAEVLLMKCEVVRALARSQRTAPRIFQPVCSNCGKMYRSVVSDIGPDGEGWYRCHNCGFESGFSIYSNGGLLSFKLELAVKWNWLKVDLHFTGVDHFPAVQSGKMVSEIVFHSAKTNFYFLNLTIQGNRGVVHKSLGNFSRVTGLPAGARCELREKLLRTPDHLLLKLPDA